MNKTSMNAETQEAASRATLERIAIRLHSEEAVTYRSARPLGQAALAEQTNGFLDHVPLHWMRDWPLPFPMVVAEAKGVRLTDIDGNQAVDFCLGDSGAMFGHAPAPVMRALTERAARGFTHMLVSDDANEVGSLLVERFGLPLWQVSTTASDANRFALRVARAVTGRRKVLVFEGCYHGAVDEALVGLKDGRTVTRSGVLGQGADLADLSVAIPFNDEAALAAALATGEIACLMAEPVMTNCSMILPQPGFHEAMRRLTKKAGTLLLIDETHTISTGPGGYTRAYGLEPDLMTIGKPVAGGIPAAVWGMTRAVAERLAVARSPDEHGHSGIGTTLSGSALQLACIKACLGKVATENTYARMNAMAERIADGVTRAIEAHHLSWHVVRIGARLEIVFRRELLVDATQVRAADLPETRRYLHLALLNKGFLLTPFHNMMLIGPEIGEAEADAFIDAFHTTIHCLTNAAVEAA